MTGQPTEGTKLCHRCGQEKPLSSFHRANTKPGGYQTQCKGCQNAAKAAWKVRQDSSPELKAMRLAKQREEWRRRRVVEGKAADITEKTCTYCEEVKPVSQFSLAPRSRDGYRYDCNACCAEYRRLRARNSLHSHLMRNYRMTVEMHDELRRRQGYRCAKCFVHEDLLDRRLRVDHDHQTLVVRGLLCGNCNIGIGMLGDSAAGALQALMYLLRAEGIDDESARLFDVAIRSFFGPSKNAYYFFPEPSERSTVTGEVAE